MGCDIHCCIEVALSQRPDEPRNFCVSGSKMIWSRDYDLFNLLAGARSDGRIEPVGYAKGLPVDISPDVLQLASYRIDDEAAADEVDGYCSRADAEDWVRSGYSVLLTDGMVSDPDIHSESWLAADELEGVRRRYRELFGRDPRELTAIIDEMKALDEGQTGRSRLVFWFKG